MAVIEFTEDDVGKDVVNANGDRVGRIVDARGGAAYVDPDPGAIETIKSKLGWEVTDEDAYRVDGDDVGEVTDDEVRLNPT